MAFCAVLTSNRVSEGPGSPNKVARVSQFIAFDAQDAADMDRFFHSPMVCR